MSGPELEQDEATEDVLGRIENSVAELGGPEAFAELPLAEAAARLDALHGELQNALTDLDRA